MENCFLYLYVQFRIDNATRLFLFLNRVQSVVCEEEEWGEHEGGRGYTYNMNKATAHARQHTDKRYIRVYRSDITLLLNPGARNIVLLNGRKNPGYFVT